MAQKLIPVTPGDILLEEFLEPMGISQAQLARDVKVPPNRINQIKKYVPSNGQVNPYHA
jgi:addiction module HigA family antidote